MTIAAPSLRVIYLEDNPFDAELTRRELARLAPEIVLEVVPTLAAALELLTPAFPIFDVVLTDLCLPDGSGLELLTHVRERELPLAVVIITGSGDQEAAVTALKAGADDYLIKRAGHVSHLPQVLLTAYNSFRTRNERRAKPLRVLYAEPNAFDFDLTNRHLARNAPHIRLEAVDSVAEILTRLSMTNGVTKTPIDVLLLDYRLPGLNALEVVKNLRQDLGLEIPIVLVTGQGNEEVAVQALRLGVDDYLIKREGYLQQLPVVLEKVQKQAELNKSETNFRHLSQEFNGLLDSIPDSIMLLDRDLKVLWYNRVTAEYIGKGMENLTGRCCYALWYDSAAPCERCPVLHCFETGSQGEETATEPNGRIWNIRTVPLVDVQGSVVKVIVLKREVTEHKKLEMQYLHAQKMESIGTLAGGVAHDFNNILTVIVGLGHLTLMKMSGDDPHRSSISGILDAAERAIYLTRELLLFSRKQESERRPVDLNIVIGKLEKFLHRVIGEDIALKRVPHCSPLPVLADSNQLGQVLMNLAVNSRDAMPQGGTFILQTEAVVLREEFVQTHGFGKPGTYALLNVSDTGEGMDKATQQRIFEPFFSTKGVGKGTGLGLAVVYGIIKQHEGYITVYSEPSQGSTFKIYLPLTAVEQRDLGALQEQPVIGGTETILFAEDNDQVRELLASVLIDAGYRVITATDGEDAVRKFREFAGPVHLLIFDLVMPKMNGKDASDEIRKIHDGVKTIFASGYAPDIAREKACLDDRSCLIYKPVSPQELLKKVRGVLDGKM